MSRQDITVREFARLTTAAVPQGLDQAQISSSAFDWLCRLSSKWRGLGGPPIFQLEDQRWLRLDNYVGVLETPCGLRIEILPKHVDTDDQATVSGARRILRRMLEASLHLPARETAQTTLQLFDSPLIEWVMGRFLIALDHVVKCGVRRAYLRVEEQERYLSGQLDLVRQLRAPPTRAHVFNMRHDLLTIDRPENRLLKSALLRTLRATRDTNNWRLANELNHILVDVPTSRDWATDFKLWRSDKLAAHYQPARPWCSLVLGDAMPLALVGNTPGISLLFPMQRLFEDYVGRVLRQHLPANYKLTAQARRKSLCQQEGLPMFQLVPDFLVEGSGETMVFDAKWKRLDGRDQKGGYGINQGDLYQLFAYGQKYLNGHGRMALIYPRTAQFREALPSFHFSTDLLLDVLPVDLETNALVVTPTWWLGLAGAPIECVL